MARFGEDYVPMDIAWSLAIEEQFYLIFPALVLILRPRTLSAILGCSLLLAPAFRMVVWRFGPQPWIGPYVLPICRMDALAAGGLISLALKFEQFEIIKALARLTPLALVVAIGALFSWTRKDLPFIAVGYSMTILASATLLARLLVSPESGWLRRAFSNVALTYLGRISYGLYLLHLIARAIVNRILPPSPIFDHRHDLSAWFLRFCCMTAIAIALATASYYLFELPILRFKDRWAPVDKSC
ncbi:MAG: acyltransferase [Pirellulales bacterium]|nr:acyltransferase [Pirellulales bacterium]